MSIAADACAVVPPDLVQAYAAGQLDTAASWSVEAHVPGCPSCRALLAAGANAARLQRNRDIVLTRLSVPEPGLTARLLSRVGVPEYVSALLAATPSLRRSWFAGVALVLGIAIGVSELAAHQTHGLAGAAGLGGAAWWTPLLPFLLIAPLLPLVAVAVAFGRLADPASLLAIAAPISKSWLLTVRAVAVIATTLVPTALAALILPGPAWLPAVILLPSLAMCAGALALATVTGAVAAVFGAAACWGGVVVATYVTVGRPSAVFGATGQLVAAAVLAASLTALARRRRAVDYGGTGW